MIYLMTVIVNIFSLFWSVSFVQSNSCIQRAYGVDKFVCVCNETKCDNDPIPKLPEFAEYLQVVSTKAGLRFHATTKKFSAAFASKATATLTINRDIKYQSISGYGASLTDSAAVNILSLSEAAQQHILQSYFTPNGLNIRYVRIPIGVSDFSTRKYYYDEVDGDVDLIHFNLTKEDYDYKIPLIKRFKQISTKELRFIAAAWSSPEWMKNHPQQEMSSVNETYYQTWANYHLKFLQAYDMVGIHFFAISTGNDPLISKIVGANSSVMLPWEPELQSKWLAENLGPTLKKNGYADVNILIVDDTTLTFEGYIEKFLKNQEAAKYIYGIAVHWYLDFRVPYALLEAINMLYPNYTIINTEASWGIKKENPVDLGDWSRAEAYVQDIIMDMNSGISAWLEWNMALDVQGGPSFVSRNLDSPIIVNATADEFYKEPMFYAIGQFSRFIQEQSIRINSTILSGEYGNNLSALTVERPDGYTVLVILNRAETDTQMIINDTGISIEVSLAKKSFNSIIYKHNKTLMHSGSPEEKSSGNETKPLQYTIFALSLCSLYIFICFF